jgi:hypothetical protein
LAAHFCLLRFVLLFHSPKTPSSTAKHYTITQIKNQKENGNEKKGINHGLTRIYTEKIKKENGKSENILAGILLVWGSKFAGYLQRFPEIHDD